LFTKISQELIVDLTTNIYLLVEDLQIKII